MRRSDQINEIAAALAKAQGAMNGASKGKVNPAFKTKYADLAAAYEACRDALSANGISHVQGAMVDPDGKFRGITTLMLHSSGQWIETDFPITPVKLDPQGIGSASTYGRRYGLMAAVGIAPEDDDGEAAMGRGHPQQQEPARAKPSVSAEAIKMGIDLCANLLALGQFWKENTAAIAALSDADRATVTAHKDRRKAEMTPAVAAE